MTPAPAIESPESLDALMPFVYGELRRIALGGQGRVWDVASVYFGLHEYDSAFVWLDRSVDDLTLRPSIFGPAFVDVRATGDSGIWCGDSVCRPGARGLSPPRRRIAAPPGRIFAGQRLEMAFFMTGAFT